jgi:hypothetical protein
MRVDGPLLFSRNGTASAAGVAMPIDPCLERVWT